MKLLLRLEEVALFLLAAFCFQYTGFTWYWFWILLLVPDIGMIGYLINPRLGALTYNFFHHKGVASLLVIAGIYFQVPILLASGIIMLGHAAMDRVFMYGLKYPDSFKNTHLGIINGGSKEQKG